jgi:hypothetical protein
MSHRRLVGIDLGIATAHTVRVLDGEGALVARRRAWPTAESLSAVEAAALAGCPGGTRLEVVIEPTGPAWLPIAIFFCARGHQVFRVSSQKAADLRRFLSRHAEPARAAYSGATSASSPRRPSPPADVAGSPARPPTWGAPRCEPSW